MSKQFRAPTTDERMIYPVDRDKIHNRSSITWLHGAEYVEQAVGQGWGKTQGYVIVAPDATTASYTLPKPGEIVSYELNDVAAEPIRATLSPTLSPAEYEQAKTTFGYDDDEYPYLARWYTAIRDEPGVTRHDIDLSGYADFPVDLLNPDALPDDPEPELLWIVAPTHLAFGAAWANTLPGEIRIERDVLGERVKALTPAGTTIWSHKFREGVFDGHIFLAYDDGSTSTTSYQPIGTRSPKKRVTQTKKRTKQINFTFGMQTVFAAPSKAEAVAALNTYVASVVAEINGYGIAVCSHCDGDGIRTINYERS